MNLGELAKKLLVNPIVSAGRAIGRDYKNTIYGADWKEKSAMRKALFAARLRKMDSDIAGDAETRAYTKTLREAQAEAARATTQERLTKQQAVASAAKQAGMSVPDYLASIAAHEMTLKDKMNQARIELLTSQGDLADARVGGAERWGTEGLDSLILRNKAAAQASLHTAGKPYTSPTTRGPKLPSGTQDLILMNMADGDKAELSKMFKVISRTQLVNAFGEDHPAVALFDSQPR